jgi:type IV pilus assembly protein PilA
MLLQKLRKRVAARLGGERESGFTLVELLVVMLILGLLAAIAIPSFFNQRDKAKDADAKAAARTAQTALETYATDNDGSYANADAGDLTTIEPSLGNATISNVTSDANSYSVTTTADDTGNTFTISRSATGVLDSECTTRSDAGCPPDGNWAAEGDPAP